MPTYRLLLRDKRQTDDLYLVYLRITQHRKIAYVGTDVYIDKNHWNPKGTLDNRDWVKKHP
ncbi:hypothetical protein GCM10028895_26500 [Pontibacter rugosus]